jgi:hypothetical protein
MDSIERQVGRARRRLLLNSWLNHEGMCLAAGAAVFLALVVLARGGGLDWPLIGIGGVLLLLATLAATIGALLKAADMSRAATALDEAVGLKERVSSGLFCRDSEDPFARAVIADAGRAVEGITVRAHMPLRWSRAMSYGLGVTVLSLLVFWLLPAMDLFGRQEASRRSDEITRQADAQKAAMLTQMARVRQIKESNPVLRDNKEFEADLDVQEARLETPMDLQRDMVKKLENLMDSVQKQKEQDKYDSFDEFKRMLRRVQDSQPKPSPVSQVADALSKGDFKEAKAAMQKLQDELAKHEQEGDREQIEKLQQQLDALGKKIEKLSTESKKAEDALKQAGIKPEDMKRLLDNLSKKDFDSVRDQLNQSNLSPEQIEKLMSKLANRKMAETMCQNLGAALQMAAAQATAQSGRGESQSGMAAAADALDQAEQLAQELNQLESTMAQLADMKNQAGCPGCQGQGCPMCQGSGSDRPGPGMGQRTGQGTGGLAPEQQTALGFKSERTPVHTTPGGIIGSFLIEGSQFKRDSEAEFNQVFISAEKDLSEAIAKDKIPPYARQTVKEYFSRGRRGTAPAEPSQGSNQE